jgi:hypothetical protein
MIMLLIQRFVMNHGQHADFKLQVVSPLLSQSTAMAPASSTKPGRASPTVPLYFVAVSHPDPAQVGFSPDGSMVGITASGTDSIVMFEVAAIGTFVATRAIASQSPSGSGPTGACARVP